MSPYVVVAEVGSENQRSTAVWKLRSVRGSQLVLTELVVVQAAFAVLVERRAKRTEIF
jgi:hypothetical protein